MSLIVLNFHGLGEPHAGVPADEHAYWLSYGAFNELLDRIHSTTNPAQFAYTFDDGNASDIEAAEILAERGETAGFFVLAGRLGQPHYLSETDLRALKAMGMMVGLHGRDHVDWRYCDTAGLSSEIEAARSELEDVLGAPISEVAIPYGRYNRKVMAALGSARFSRIHTSDGGFARASDTIWHRNTLRNDMSKQELAMILSGGWTKAINFKRAVSALAKHHLI